MSTKNFMAGVGIGVLAGATLAVVIAPPDKKRMMKSKTGKALRAVTEVMNGITSVMM